MNNYTTFFCLFRTLDKSQFLMKSLVYFIFLIVFFYIVACAKQAIPPQADITNIYNITDTSVNVDVQVTKQSNSQYDIGLSLIVDSVPINGNKIKVQQVYFDVVDRLASSYSTKISNLKNKTLYSIYLYYGGVFDIGGPNESEYFTIGSPKTFTTN